MAGVWQGEGGGVGEEGDAGHWARMGERRLDLDGEWDEE